MVKLTYRTMHYVAYTSHEDGRVLAELPDCPGCQTFADNEAAIMNAPSAMLATRACEPPPKRS